MSGQTTPEPPETPPEEARSYAEEWSATVSSLCSGGDLLEITNTLEHLNMQGNKEAPPAFDPRSRLSLLCLDISKNLQDQLTASYHNKIRGIPSTLSIGLRSQVEAEVLAWRDGIRSEIEQAGVICHHALADKTKSVREAGQLIIDKYTLLMNKIT